MIEAVQWLEHTLLGTIATTVAIVAVGWVGFMTLSGRLNIRHGATVILGCFVLFGAASIAAGIRAAAGQSEASDFASAPPVAPIVIPPRSTPNYDPYAGASVPRR